MNTFWVNALNKANSIVVNDVNATDTWISLLDDIALLAVIGPDAGKFLQGQLSCDINSNNPQHATPGSHCNPQGRMLSNFRVINPAQQYYYLAMQADLADIAQKSLQKYIVFSKATLTKTEDYTSIGINGPKASEIIKDIFGDCPQQLNDAITTENGTIVQIDNDSQTFEIYLKASAEKELIALLTKAKACEKRHWNAARIRHGIWYINGEQSGEHIPLVIGLDKIEGISYKKGCYTGQEIIARMHYRGKAKRRMVALSFPTDSAINLKDKISAVDTNNEVGEIVAIARTKNLTTALAILNLSEDEVLPSLQTNQIQGQPV
jgi:folate-binding protein YgfZ